MPSGQILLLCMLGAALLSSVLCNNAIGPDDCCFKIYPRRLNKNLIKSYYMTDYRCPKLGAILVTNKGRHICVDPNMSWVDAIMKSVDENSF
ncbi:C-C motif chemokine 4 homolog [Xyrichtys novacula]|uniref:C-C motif chemokine 4 homolog n=1 Tax=Xyrichtys novacula TaxID=13765 RepID=A0AAV1HL53_XYRNO|nr:C-C motif chemokine 4 homolog [Xyrichtys novacula]